MTNQKIFKGFVVHLKSQKKSVHTVAAYQTDINQFLTYLKEHQLKPTQIKFNHLQEYQGYLKSRSLSPKSITRKLNALRSFFRYLTHTKVISKNIAQELSTTTPPEPEVKILSPLEYRALRDIAIDNYLARAVIELVLQTGLKPQEIINLRTTDFDQKKSILTANNRPIPLSTPAMANLKQYLDHRPTSRHQALFQNQFKKPLSLRSLNQKINRLFQRLNLKGSLMTLRHTFIYHQLQAGISPTIIQQITGLKSIASLSKYLKILDLQQFPSRLQPL